MHEFPETRESLLVQVKDPANREAWQQFAQLYRPVIFRIAMRRGLQDADAHDLAQQVLVSVVSAIGRWEKSEAGTRFRHWLNRVIKNAIVNSLTRQPRDRATGGSSAQIELDDCAYSDQVTEELIDLEYRRELYLAAADRVKVEVETETWEAFDMSVVQGLPVDDVAKHLGKSRGAIYSARNRVMFRLRQIVRILENQS
ncbi:sigma-70 family RNA polymerase sigma factor [Novipirellula artificiosorum]|uniref:RNA polymerase sigma factor RpoE n=1 Tax=Novipirellula artificiosorum TaxID=2528016 RepID=A0A5C6DS81_9BACT|nr:sigma-70 family RNA polymerase sigma factor [Novipirellula artificiosorum]TWU39532.1 RNA polymerase sigma factor RpoE [Novipirellula artificiosorum]